MHDKAGKDKLSARVLCNVLTFPILLCKQEVITKDYTRQSQQQQQSYHGSPVLDLTRPPSASQPPPTSQESAQGSRYAEGGECIRDR